MSWLARLISGESDEEYFARCPDEPYRVTHDGRTVANPARTAALIREIAMARPKNYDPKYCAWVASQGCMISGRPATLHHVLICGGRRDDHRILPLAPEYHLYQHGPKTSIEGLGRRGFEAKYGVDIEERVADYRRRYLAR